MAKRVMIVDPSLYSRMVLRNILAGAGYSVCCEVPSGAEALAKYEKANPDLVLIEAHMPGMDGVATITELCRNYMGCQALILASAGQRAEVCEALSAGAVDFIPKPLNDRRVATALRRLQNAAPPSVSF